MSDHDIAGSAWVISPSQYLEKRPPTHQLPSKPQSQYIVMPDGCRLATDVYIPSGGQDNRFATIVIFTPYNRRFKLTGPGAEPTPNIAKYRDFFVPRGYVLVAVDVRGTGASFGTREALRSPKEINDAKIIADWIVTQGWSNGVIGSTGISYLGAAACFLASTGHPAVKAIAPLFSVSDIYNEQLFPGGMLSRVWSQNYDELMLALDHNDKQKISKFPYFNDPRLDGPQPVDEDIDGELLIQAIEEHRNNFSLHDLMPELAFRDKGPLHAPELNTDACSPFHYLLKGINKDLPVYSISGWCDGGGYANGAISRYLTLKGRYDRLLIGPWDHGARTNVSPFRCEASPQFMILAEVLRFFDQHLLGLNTEIEREQPIHIFSMHAEKWRGARTWPPVDSKKFFLCSEGELSALPAYSTTKKSYQVRFDTSSGSQTRWERLGAANVTDYYLDWNDRDQSMLNFTSDAFATDMELSGHIVANLHLSSSQRDAAVFIYASEIDSQGRSYYITEGMLRALHRKTSAAPENYQTTWPYRRYFRSDSQPLIEGQSFNMQFALLPVSWTLKAGSRLRLSIAGADRNHFPMIPNGMPPILTFNLGGDEGSYVDIPIKTLAPIE